MISRGISRRLAVALIVLLCVAPSFRTQAAESDSSNLFPYAYTIDDLDNGLRVVTVPTDYPNMIALYQRITPQDIRTIASQYFKDSNRTIITLTSKAAKN